MRHERPLSSFRFRPAPVIRFPKLAGRYVRAESCFSELPESGHRFVEL
jgi:hypothetical protein